MKSNIFHGFALKMCLFEKIESNFKEPDDFIKD